MSHADYIKLRALYGGKSFSDYDQLKPHFEGRPWLDVKKEILERGETFRVNRVGDHVERIFDANFVYNRHNIHIDGRNTYEYVMWTIHMDVRDIAGLSSPPWPVPPGHWDDIRVIEYTGRG